MINDLILFLEEEIDKLENIVSENNKKRSICLVIEKIINHIKITNSLEKEICSSLKINSETDIDTLHSIEQNNLPEDISSIETKIFRNKFMIQKLKSNEEFTLFVQLKEILEEYSFSADKIYEIMDYMIKKNYEINAPKKEETFKRDDIDVVVDAVKISKKKELLNLFNQYRLSYKKIDGFEGPILDVDIDIEKAKTILDILKDNGVNIKSFFEKKMLSFLRLIIYSEPYIVNSVIEMIKQTDLKVADYIKNNSEILISEKNYGMYENFKANFDFFTALEFDHKKGTILDDDYPDLYLINNYYITNAFNLYKNVYKIRYRGILDIEALGTEECITAIDRIIEASSCPFEFINYNICYVARNNTTFFLRLKHISRQLDKHPLTAHLSNNGYFITLTNLLNFLYKRNDYTKFDMSNNLNKYALKSIDLNVHENLEYEHDSIDDKLDLMFSDEETDFHGYPVKVIPIDIMPCEPTELNNEFVNYLEQRYKRNEWVYQIKQTRISRIKVLRFINYMLKCNIDITEDVVKYGLKLNYIFLDKDLQNINNAFDEMKYNQGYQKKIDKK